MTARRWWGLLAACGAVFCFAMAGSYCTGCTPAERAPIERKLSGLLTDEQLACMFAEHVPGVPGEAHDAIVLACGITADAAGAALAILEAADAMHAVASDAGRP